ncbi:hypothetical protein FHW12_002079 [Dokdonella fugitiva]|uniref:Uncharacterized protein n=1 Tax=Dokdonella fugitiva TaxID=328517 RepID=A0A839EVT2_9GAMM|nr:hypothetical protein [Dokdonella fugitiva]MBA8887865.1 hypothetical protein [Dokdonella fugitiva]
MHGVRCLLQHRFEIGSRIDDLRDARDQLEARRAPARTLVAVRVRDRDAGVACERLQRLQCIGRQNARRRNADAEESRELALPVDRHADHLVVGEFRQCDARDVAVARDHRLAGLEYGTRQADARPHLGAQFALGHAVDRGGADQIPVPIVQSDRAVVGADEQAGVFGDPRQQRLQLQLAADLLDEVP